MEQPTITAADIARFHSLNTDFKALQELASDAIATAKLTAENQIDIIRDGKTVTVHEQDLWDEVWVLGRDCEGGKILAGKYPAAFDLSRQSEEKKKELQAFAKGQWNIDPLAMSLSDIIRLIEGVVDYKLKPAA